MSTLFNLVSAFKINKLLANNNVCEDDYNYKETSFGTLSLTEIDLSSNELGNKDFAALCNTLCNHKNLRVLRLNNNFVNEGITKHLVVSILQWHNFEILECEGNIIQDIITTTELIQFTIDQMKFQGKAINFDSNIGIFLFYWSLDPFVINCLYILEWFKSLRPFSCSLRPFSCLLRPFSCLLRPLQLCEPFDWLK